MQSALIRLIPALAALLFLAAACGPGAPSNEDVLVGIADEVAVPAYQALADGTAQLDSDAAALCAAPGQGSLDAARASWRTARASWMRTAAVQFGPVMERRSVRLLGWTPTDTEAIDASLDEGAVSVEHIREVVGSDVRGFGAAEHLLFGEGALDGFAAPAARCAYLTGLTQVMREEAAALLSDWTEGTGGSPPYKDYFTGRSSASALSSVAVADAVRRQVFLIRGVVDMRLADALGLRGAVDLSMIPGHAAANGVDDLRNEVLGMRAAYEGVGEGLGLSDLVRPLSAETD